MHFPISQLEGKRKREGERERELAVELRSNQFITGGGGAVRMNKLYGYDK